MQDYLLSEIERLPAFRIVGQVVSIRGLLVECIGIEKALSVGAPLRGAGGDAA